MMQGSPFVLLRPLQILAWNGIPVRACLWIAEQFGKSILHILGYRVFEARTGEQALTILKDQPGFWQHPIVEHGLVTKVGVDATVPLSRSSDFERVKFKQVNLKDYLIEE